MTVTAPTESKKRKSFGGESKCRVWFIQRRRQEKKSAASLDSVTNEREAASQGSKEPQSPGNVVVSPELPSQETQLLRWDDKLERLITNHSDQQGKAAEEISDVKPGNDDETVDELRSEDEMLSQDLENQIHTQNMKPRVSRGYGKKRTGIRKPFTTLRTMNNGYIESKTGIDARSGSTPSPCPPQYGSSICALGSVAVKRKRNRIADVNKGARKGRNAKTHPQKLIEQPNHDNSHSEKTPLSIAREYFRQLDANHSLHLEDEMDREVFGSPLAGASQHCQTLRTQRTLDIKSPRLLAEYCEYCKAAETSGVNPLNLEEFAEHRGQYFKNGLFDGFLDG